VSAHSLPPQFSVPRDPQATGPHPLMFNASTWRNCCVLWPEPVCSAAVGNHSLYEDQGWYKLPIPVYQRDRAAALQNVVALLLNGGAAQPAQV